MDGIQGVALLFRLQKAELLPGFTIRGHPNHVQSNTSSQVQPLNKDKITSDPSPCMLRSITFSLR